ncbi:Protein sum2 [Daldinia childiae]|uniref:Protein sum2 n=1 Tax=Daldinia childiae TaxID=326645 RepID=UPI0014482EAF|nr:Protein sum2 [Daldinia childiae]KAF3070435.1 Protein sum2 [Daldinia childiae]
MSEFLGSRISLISKSDIRYSGVLHEINSEESTVSLENVRSFGTEGRKGSPEEEIAPSDQVYEYIVFRGSDVKDLRIEQAPIPPKENQPPKVPDDPAIVGARTRPGPGPGPGPAGAIPAGAIPPGPGAPGYGQSPYQPNPFYPPPPGQWGRGGPGPVPGQGFHGMPYPPPLAGFLPAKVSRLVDLEDPVRGIALDTRLDLVLKGLKDLKDPLARRQTKTATYSTHLNWRRPDPPVESKPTAAEVKATVESLSTTNAPPTNVAEKKAVPTGPKNNRVLPAVPIQAAVTPKIAPQVTAAASTVKPVGGQAATQAALKDATQAAKEAVAVAMAKLNNAAAEPPTQNGSAMDNLTKKVNEMRMNAPRSSASGRGRGRGGRSGGPSKVNVPDSDFDFEAGNAKFNKQDLVKEAIAGPPLAEIIPNTSVPEQVQTDDSVPPVAYNKTTSFFDNISSEAKDRAENGGQKPGGREWRGEEQRKNMETFGQGSVDGGYRGGYRGRGRGGRGGPRGRGFAPRGRGNAYRQPAAQ